MEEQSMRVIGLDPGKITSWSDGEDTGSFPADDGKVVAHFAEHLDIDVAYIEGAYVHEKKTNYSHIIQHCIRIGRLIQAFESLDIRVVVVPAMTWKSQVLVIGGERVINNTAAQKILRAVRRKKEGIDMTKVEWKYTVGAEDYRYNTNIYDNIQDIEELVGDDVIIEAVNRYLPIQIREEIDTLIREGESPENIRLALKGDDPVEDILENIEELTPAQFERFKAGFVKLIEP
jgi:hypothetical protein